MKIILNVLLLLSMVNSVAFAKGGSFEDVLSDFKYSLYRDFAEIQKAHPKITLEQYLSKPDNPIFQNIEKKLSVFFEKNKENIVRYRLAKLKKYQHTSFDRSNLVSDKALMDSTINKIPDHVWKQLTRFNWMRLAHLDPTYQAAKVVELVIEKEKKVEDFVNLKVIETLARPKIKTQELKQGWQIIIDKYSTVYTCFLNEKTGNIKIVNIQVRKH